MIKWLLGKGNDFNETEAENKLLAEKWHNYSNFADLEKIKNSMITVKLFMENQSNLEYYFTENEYNYLINKSTDLTNSQRFKKEMRSGIPVKYTRGIILKMFNVESSSVSVKDNYKTRFLSIFKNRDPKNLGEHVPYLSYTYTLEENLTTHFLNKSGLETTKELMWLLYSVVPNIEFCPILIKIISFLLIFLTKEEIFSAMKNLIIIDYSSKNLSKIRFRLRFNYDENKRLIPAFIESFKIISRNTGKDLAKKFEKLNFDFEILVEDMFFNLFLGYLNFSLLHRVFILYLNEGCKILFRVAYAILKILKNDIMNIAKAENVINIIKSKAFEIKDEYNFFTIAFAYNLKETNNMYEEVKVIEHFKPIKVENFYIPTINGESNILNDEDIFYLWNIFPENFRLKDAKMIFSTDFHGFSLDKIYEMSLDSENSCFNCFIIIQTKNFEVFGVLMSLPLDRNRNGFYKPAYTSIFTLKPKAIRYDAVEKIENLEKFDKMVLCTDEKVVIGLGNDGPALEIDKDLLIGFSYKSEIFNSPSLTGKADKSFEIAKLEVFILY